jgi:methyl-accepting chemotaxis protein
MNFDDAVNAHSQWKARLQAAINGSTREVLDPVTIAMDNKCVLGQWIYGEAKVHSELPEYVALKKEHASFHQCAAEVLRTHLGGDSAKAKVMIDPGGVFYDASIKTITAIRRLRAKVEK